MKPLLLLLLLAQPWIPGAHATANPAPVLFGRAHHDGPPLALDDAQLRWLWQRQYLRLAVVRPDNPPLDILGIGREYEGISADYAGLLGERLQVRMQVMVFASVNEAAAAVKAGEADLLAGIDQRQAEDAGLRLSIGYAQDTPLLVGREEDVGRHPAAEPLRLAMREGYRPLEAVLALYPQAQVQVYPSARMALGAVSFGQADLFLGSELEGHHQIAKGLLGGIEALERPALPRQALGFGMAADNLILQGMVDAVLREVGHDQRQRILQRWAGRGPVERSPMPLSEQEQRWIETRAPLRVLVNVQYPPVSYRDGDGRLRGLAIDVLERVAARTGLQLEFADGGSVENMIDKLQRGEADLIAGITPSAQREDLITFSRAFFSSPRVLMTADTADAPVNLEQLAGRRVALTGGSSSWHYLGSDHPDIRRVQAEGPVDAVWRVASGRADAALIPLVGAQALVERMHPTRLKVSAVMPVEAAYFTLASQRGALELQSILNKALLNLSPQEMEALARRWRNQVVVADTFWQRYRVQVLQGFALVALALLLALAWVRYLRRLVRVREQAEQALADQLAFMRVMIDGTPHPIYVCDRSGRLLTCNNSYLQALGVASERVLGQPLAAEEAGACLQVLADGQPRIEDCPVRFDDGRDAILYRWMLPYGNSEEGGVIAGWIDITDRQRLQAELRVAKEQADAANQAKTRFLATMSHEIRTPMNAVLGMLELAMRKAEQGVLDRLSIEVASDAARGLLELIGDILDVTRIESGHLSLSPQPVQLREHVAGVVQLFEQQARAKGLQLLLELDGPVDREVLLDPLRSKQVLANLISNAIKFTHKGSVRVGLRARAVGHDLAVELSVEDSGIGIPEADLDQLGSLFWQASNNQQSGRRGAGLGLSISRTLCELMGGRMHLRSTQGVGTCIDIELLLKPVSVSESPPALIDLGQSAFDLSLRILVVDDYPANRLLLANQLGYLGHRTQVAENGAQALRLWLEHPFDVVISDCSMPLMDGYALARAIRLHEQRGRRARCRMLGVTANALPDERERCRASGMDDCLFKPVGLRQLGQALLGQWQDAQRGEGSEPALLSDALDLSSLERLTAGDDVALAALLRDLRQSNQEDLQAFAGHAERNELCALTSLAHRIKGGARMVRARRLVEACEQVERDCALGTVLPAHLDGMHQAMDELERLLARHCTG